MKNTAITTDRLVLRAFRNSDLDDTILIFMDDSIKKTYMLPDFPSSKDAIPLFEKLKALSNGNEKFVFAITHSDRVIGFMNEVERKEDSIEVGYVIHPDHQNKGYATEALTALIHHLHRAGFPTVVAGYFEENPASGRVMEKSAMKRISFTEEIEYRGKTHHCIYYEHRCDA